MVVCIISVHIAFKQMYSLNNYSLFVHLMYLLQDIHAFLFVDCSIEDHSMLEGVIVLEEFCKELAAIAFVKHHASAAETTPASLSSSR